MNHPAPIATIVALAALIPGSIPWSSAAEPAERIVPSVLAFAPFQAPAPTPLTSAGGASPSEPSATAKPGASTTGQGAAESSPPAASSGVSMVSLGTMSDDVAGKKADVTLMGRSPKDESPYLGPRDALVVVNLFTDFQCPVCRRAADPVKQLVLDFPDRVKVVFRNNALESHGRSKPAALAAKAAAQQGKFWQYYDRIFANPTALDDGSLRRIAQDLDLDMAQWDKDVADPKNLERIKEESAWAVQLGAAGTPGIFVNGLKQMGWGSYWGLQEMVAREIAAAEKLAASGTPLTQIPVQRIRAAVAEGAKPSAPAGAPADPDMWVSILTAD